MSGGSRRFLQVLNYPSRLVRATFVTSTAHTARVFQYPPENRKSPACSFSTSSIAHHNPSVSRKGKNEMGSPKHEPPARHPFAGPIGAIRESIQSHKVKKWGYVVYRCDYSSDETWAKFMSNLEWNMKHSLEGPKAPDLLTSLEITVKEDREALDRASVDQVRELFKSWVQGDEAAEELREAPYPGPFYWPRYTYCVHIDADAIDSVLNRAPQPPKMDLHGVGYVNLIKLFETDFMQGSPNDDNDVEEDEIDEDEGDPYFVKVPLYYMDAETYGNLFNEFAFERMARYRRKEDGVSWGR